MILFDEAIGDSTACCGEVPGPSGSAPGVTGPGGGDVGAVLLSPFIAPATTSSAVYNHYSMLGSVEDLFGLPRLADAVGTTGFGADIYTRPNGPVPTPTPTPTPTPVAPQDSGLKLKPASFSPQPMAAARKHHGTTVSYSDSQAAVTKLTVKRVTSGYHFGTHACKALRGRRRPPKHSKPCAVTRAVGSFTHQDLAGSNSFPFTGRLRGHPLASGSYILEATPTLGGLSGKTRTARFHIT